MGEEKQIRELFIEELTAVNGGGPVEKVLDRLGVQVGDPGIWNTTHACCEEGTDGCCA